MSREDIKERIVRTITEVLELTPDEQENLRTEVGYKMLKKWTSARHAEIIVALEDEFDLEIDELSIPGLNNVAKIIAYIESHSG